MDSLNVACGKPASAGPIYVGPTTVTLPTSASGTIPTGMSALGFVSEDGVSNNNSATSEDIKAWGGAVVMTSQTEKTDTFQFTLIESRNVDVLKTVYGDDNVSVSSTTDEISVTATADEAPTKAWIIDMIYADESAHRICIPKGKISEVGEIVYKDDEVVGYPITITALYTDGVSHYEYIEG